MMKKTRLIAGFLAALISFPVLFGSTHPAQAAGDYTAASITLLAAQGTVAAKDRKGTALSTKAGTHLLSGCTVTTAADSYAWLNLDDENALKLDADTEVLVTKYKENLDVTLNKGSIFFDVSKKLPDTANYHIRSANMVMGIRGTIGFVQVIDDNHSVIGVLEGLVHVRVIDRLTGKVTEGDIAAGQIADTNDLASQGTGAAGKKALNIRKITKKMVPGFIVAETASGNAADTARVRFGRGSTILSGRIYDACGVDLRGVLPEDLPDNTRPQETAENNAVKDALYNAWLAFDTQLKKEAQEELEKLIAAQPKAEEEEVVQEVVQAEPKKEEAATPAVTLYTITVQPTNFSYTISPGTSVAAGTSVTITPSGGPGVTVINPTNYNIYAQSNNGAPCTFTMPAYNLRVIIN